MIGIGRVVIKGSESRRNLGKIFRRWFFFFKIKGWKSKGWKIEGWKSKGRKSKGWKIKGW